jgi:hypothetical protein
MMHNTFPPILELLYAPLPGVCRGAGIYGTDRVAESIARRAYHDRNRE